MNLKHQTIILIGVLMLSTYLMGEVFVGDSVVERTQGEVVSDPVSETISLYPIKSGAVVDLTARVERSSLPLSQKDSACHPSARIASVVDISSGDVLYEKNAFIRWPIASITKLMSAVIAEEMLDEEDVITIEKDAIERSEGYASFKEGQRYSVRALIAAMLVFSSNDASFTLSSHIGEEEFIKAMNERASQIGMSQTRFTEPSGLSYLNQSTAEDIVKLLSYLYQHKPDLLDLSSTYRVYLEERESGRKTIYTNIHAFAGERGFLGGKTGFIDESGGNVVGLFMKEERLLSVIVFSSSSRFEDISKLLSCVEDL